MSIPPHDSSSPSNAPSPAAAPPRIVALRGDDSQYQGDLLRDIMTYRNLRAIHLGGGPLTDEQSSMLQSLEARVRQPHGDEVDEQSALRSFYRFRCDFNAELRRGDSDEFSTVSVADISAGGLKIVGTNRQELGDAVVISFDRGGDSRLEFAARVAWARDIEYGIMFAGAPTTTG
ncbi:MAG: PilZ domain-containing protein [Nannocystaceae bacterium]